MEVAANLGANQRRRLRHHLSCPLALNTSGRQKVQNIKRRRESTRLPLRMPRDGGSAAPQHRHVPRRNSSVT